MVLERVWRGLEGPTIEHLRLDADDPKRASGLVVGVVEGVPIRLSYAVQMDQDWRARGLQIDDLLAGIVVVDLRSDVDGRWSNLGQERPDLDGCVDVDLSITPFTNLLPIRRLERQPGVARSIDVVYVEVPAMTVARARQEYTFLSAERWRFSSGAFQREILVDAHGLVIDYPGLFERVWGRP